MKPAIQVLAEYFANGLPVRYFCQDETRLGLKTLTGKKITLKGIKPIGSVQWKRENFYLYGVVEPLTGESYFYEFSHLDTRCFQVFINQISQFFGESINFIQLDNASFHHSIDWPENIIPIFQPAYSPELNPIERFWEYLKAQLRWKNFSSLKKLRQEICVFLQEISTQAVASLIGWEYITDAVLSATS